MEIFDACPSCGRTDYARKIYKCNQCGKIFCYKDTAMNPQSGCSGTKYERCDCGKGGYLEVVAPDITQIGVVGGEGKCFIATAVYGSENTYEVTMLRRFRDEILLPTMPGRVFTRTYYIISPTIVKFITSNRVRKIIRNLILQPIVKLADKQLLKRSE
ncbi:MAG: hypothetical protein H6696_14755 [Deferribacteres bacterium]|nr:hypothetical protein [candidate division KSB1 bacterium]MCB9503188.1 hypothetical protein [Deferribacteres bacterium]